MRFGTDQSDIDRVREATDLVRLIGEHVALRPKGREHVGLCPFHDDHTPSMAVVTHKGTPFYKCHACGAAGDAFEFFMQFHRVDFSTALKELAARAGIELTQHRRSEPGRRDERQALRAANAFALAYFRAAFNHPAAGEPARKMSSDRGFTDETMEAFQLGFAPAGWDGLVNLARNKGVSADDLAAAGLLKDRERGEGRYDTFRNRLIFPICNELGQAIAFGGRRIDPEDEPKYLNSPESPLFNKSATLYGLNLAKRAMIDARTAIITEGYTDVIACHQAGVKNVVATLGTALTSGHARMLERCCERIILVFDGDAAGQNAADRAVEMFFRHPVDVGICTLPPGSDPADLLQQPDGVERFRTLVDQSVDALDFKLDRFRASLADTRGVSARQRLLESFMGDLSRLGFSELQGVRRRPVVTQIADALGVAVDDVDRFARSIRTPARVAASAASSDAAEELVAGFDPVSPARRRAERALIATIVFEPGTMNTVVERGGTEMMLADALTFGGFVDAACSELARAVYRLHESGRSIAVPELRDELSDEQLRGLAASLYFDGQRIVEQTEQQDAALAAIEAFAALEACVARDRREQSLNTFRQREKADGGDDLAAASAILTELRASGGNPVAIPRGVR